MPWNLPEYEVRNVYQLRIQNRTSEVFTFESITLFNAQWKVWTLARGQRLSAGTNVTCAIAPQFPTGSTQPVSWTCLLEVSAGNGEFRQPPQSFIVQFGRWVDWKSPETQENFVGQWLGYQQEPVVQTSGDTPRFEVQTRQKFLSADSVACSVVDIVPVGAPRVWPGVLWGARTQTYPRPGEDWLTNLAEDWFEDF